MNYRLTLSSTMYRDRGAYDFTPLYASQPHAPHQAFNRTKCHVVMLPTWRSTCRGVRALCVQHAHVPRGKTCLIFSWLHSLRCWSVLKTRGGSNCWNRSLWKNKAGEQGGNNLFQWLLEQPQQALLDLLALCVAVSSQYRFQPRERAIE